MRNWVISQNRQNGLSFQVFFVSNGHMKKVLFVILIAGCMLAGWNCNGSKKSGADQNKSDWRSVMQNPSFDLSPKARAFVDAALDEASDDKLSDFTPSVDLRDQYRLIDVDGQFAIGGFVRTNSDFDPEGLQAQGIQVSSKTSGIASVMVPLNQLPVFLQFKGITYFDLHEKVHSKNQP